MQSWSFISPCRLARPRSITRTHMTGIAIGLSDSTIAQQEWDQSAREAASPSTPGRVSTPGRKTSLTRIEFTTSARRLSRFSTSKILTRPANNNEFLRRTRPPHPNPRPGRSRKSQRTELTNMFLRQGASSADAHARAPIPGRRRHRNATEDDRARRHLSIHGIKPRRVSLGRQH